MFFGHISQFPKVLHVLDYDNNSTVNDDDDDDVVEMMLLVFKTSVYLI